MGSRDFAYWLMGFFEITDAEQITPEQTRVIKNHLKLVFKHEIDPSIDGGDPEKIEAYHHIHNGTFNSGDGSTILHC